MNVEDLIAAHHPLRRSIGYADVLFGIVVGSAAVWYHHKEDVRKLTDIEVVVFPKHRVVGWSADACSDYIQNLISGYSNYTYNTTETANGKWAHICVAGYKPFKLFIPNSAVVALDPRLLSDTIKLTEEANRGGRIPTGMYVLSEKSAYNYYNNPDVDIPLSIRATIWAKERELTHYAESLRQILSVQRGV